MKISLSGHHVEITDSIRNTIESKFQKVGSHYPDVTRIDIIVNVEKNDQTIDAKTQYMGTTVNVKAHNADLYTAIADAVKKMEAALKSKSGSAKSHLRDKPVFNTEE